MKQLKGKIDLLFDRDKGLEIRVEDKTSGVQFLEVNVPAESVCTMLSRQTHINCDLEVRGLELVGKHEWFGDIEFRLPGSLQSYHPDREAVTEYCNKICPDNFNPSNYWGSQNSFFERDGMYWARTTVRTYLKNKEDKPIVPEDTSSIRFVDIRAPVWRHGDD